MPNKLKILFVAVLCCLSECSAQEKFFAGLVKRSPSPVFVKNREVYAHDRSDSFRDLEQGPEVSLLYLHPDRHHTYGQVPNNPAVHLQDVALHGTYNASTLDSVSSGQDVFVDLEQEDTIPLLEHKSEDMTSEASGISSKPKKTATEKRLSKLKQKIADLEKIQEIEKEYDWWVFWLQGRKAYFWDPLPTDGIIEAQGRPTNADLLGISRHLEEGVQARRKEQHAKLRGFLLDYEYDCIKPLPLLDRPEYQYFVKMYNRHLEAANGYKAEIKGILEVSGEDDPYIEDLTRLMNAEVSRAFDIFYSFQLTFRNLKAEMEQLEVLEKNRKNKRQPHYLGGLGYNGHTMDD